MIKVVQVQFSIESGARSAIRLQNAFMTEGISSNIVSLQVSPYQLKNVNYLGKKERLTSRLDEKIQRTLVKYNKKDFGLFSYPVLGSDISQHPQVQQADIIYLHWALGGFLNFRSYYKIAALGKPVVIVLHDMWSISGGCHYSFTCEKYMAGCNNCQMFPGITSNDYAAKGFKKKSAFYSRYKNLYFVAPSRWIYNCAKDAKLTREKPVFYIPNVIDTQLFKPFDKQTAKRILGLDDQKPVIAFGAVSVDSPYKGWKFLQEALEKLKSDEQFSDLQVLIFGSGANDSISDSIPFKTKFMGFLMDEYSTMLVYNAADVFIAPSLADVGPATVQESLCCGTPVVGFDIGGIPDMIRHKVNGYLAKYRDGEDICNGIKFCLGNSIKGYMLPGFTAKETVSKHLELINSALQSNN
jgi:glycosyltransferase involved in cell wall biosynthesis